MKIQESLSKTELKYFLQKSNWHGFFQVFFSWAIIALLFFGCAYYSYWLIVPAIFLMGARQLALEILMHDAGHWYLFKTRWLNDFMGKWFCSYPLMQDVTKYRSYHLQHHKYTGQPYKGDKGDTDLTLVRAYPLKTKTLVKWFLRDLSGRTGLLGYAGLALMNTGYLKYDLGGRVIKLPQPKRNIWQKFSNTVIGLHGFLITNAIIFFTLYHVGHPLLYLLWAGAALTTHLFFARIRAIGEHGMVERSDNQLRNTRTTYAGWFARLFVAPYYVNYHLEHHALIGVPNYKLPKLHKLIKERGLLEGAPVEKNYWQVLKLATRG